MVETMWRAENGRSLRFAPKSELRTKRAFAAVCLNVCCRGASTSGHHRRNMSDIDVLASLWVDRSGPSPRTPHRENLKHR